MATTATNHKDTSFLARYGATILRGGITAIPTALYRYQKELALTPQLVWFISAILAHKWDEDLPYPSLRKMAEETGVSRRHLHRYQLALVDAGWLTVINRQTTHGGKATNFYDFTPLFAKLEEFLQRDKSSGDDGGYVTAASHTHVTPVSHTHVTAASPLKETYKEETIKEEIYPSNIRKAKSDGIDYVNSTSSANGAAAGDSLTHNEEVGASQPHSSTNGRNIEENEKYKTFLRAQNMRSSSLPGEPPRKGGVTHIGQTLQGRLPIVQPTVPAVEARDAIERLIRDTAAKLHDEAPLKSSTSRAFNLYQRSGVDLGTFFSFMYDAEKEANRRSATIKKLTTQGYKNRMVYFFALLEDKLGFREKPSPSLSQSP